MRVPPEDIEPLSKIIAELNEQFETRFTDEDQLTRDKILEQQLQVGSKDAVRLSFEQVAQDAARLRLGRRGRRGHCRLPPQYFVMG